MYVQFNNPGSDTQLIVGTMNTLTVGVTGNTGNTISWSVVPIAALSGAKSGTAQVLADTATFSFGIKVRPDTESQHMVLVSIWDTAAPGAGHYTALYRCATPRMDYSISQTYAESADPQAAPFNENDPDPAEVLMLDLWLRDADDGMPLKNSKITWTAYPRGNPIYVLTPDNKTPQLDPADRSGNTFLTFTGADGRSALKFGNTAPSIIAMNCTWGGVRVRPFPLVFSALGTPWLDAGLKVPPNIPNPLRLADYDDTGVPVIIEPDPDVSWMTNGTAIVVSFWLNGFMTLARQAKVGDTVKIPKQYFESLNDTDQTLNNIGYTISQAASDNGVDSNQLPFNVIGNVPPAIAQRPSPVLSDWAPYISGNPDPVDAKVIAGGLQIYVPQAFNIFHSGDVVVMNLFLNGYFPDTIYPRIATLSSQEFPIPSDQLGGGFSFVFSESQLAGFDGPGATLIAQYEVRPSGGGGTLYSGTLSVALTTAQTSGEGLRDFSAS